MEDESFSHLCLGDCHLDREAVQEALESIDPQKIEDRICSLSAVASDIEEVRDERGQVIDVREHYQRAEIGRGGSRLAFSEADFHSRDEILSWVIDLILEEGGELESIEQTDTAVITIYKIDECIIKIEENPAGLIITYEGLEPSLPGVAVGSHNDTILSAGKEDGQGGVVTGFVVLEAFIRNRIRPVRSLSLLIVTGEDDVELAFSGSKMMAEGISRTELDTRLKIGFSLREGVGRWVSYMEDKYIQQEVHFDEAKLFKALERPLLNEGQFGHHLEVHANPVPGGENPVSIVEAVTGSLRYRFTVTLGEYLQRTIEGYFNQLASREIDYYPCIRISIHVKGKGGHVAGEPMNGDSPRSDVLLAVYEFLSEFILFCGLKGIFTIYPTIPIFQLRSASLNSIPRECDLTINLFPSLYPTNIIRNELEIWRHIFPIMFELVKIKRGYLSNSVSFDLKGVRACQVKREDMSQQMPLNVFHLIGANLARSVEIAGREAEKLALEGNSSTVATATLSTLEITGPTSLSAGVDLRSSSEYILRTWVDWAFRLHLIPLFHLSEIQRLQPIPGSEPPAEMREAVLQDIEQAARFLCITAPRVTVRAGEDAQVLQKKIEYVAMLLYRSSGSCHTTSEDADLDDRAIAARLQFLTVLSWMNQIS